MPVILQFGLGLLMLAYLAFAGFSFWTMFQIGDIRKHEHASVVLRVVYWHGVALMVELALLMPAGIAVLAVGFVKAAWRVMP